MKIVIINNLYKPYVRGGAERILEIIVEGLGKAGHEVVVVSTKPIKGVQPPIGGWTPSPYMFFPWNIISYYNLNKLPIVFRPLWHLINIFNIQSYFKIKKILKREQPDVVMTHNLMGVGFLTALAVKRFDLSRGSGRTASCRHIHTLHDIQLLHPSGLMNVGQEKKVDSLFAKIYQAINKKLFSKADVVISPSRWVMGMHTDRGFFGKSKCVVMRNPIQFSRDFRFRGNDNSGNDTNNKFTFLYVGQIEKHKGIGVMLDSFTQLKDDNCILKIVGDGGAVGPLLRERSNRSNTQFLGRKTPEEVKELMQTANCFVLPSLCYENQPTVILEAQQNKLPVIASNIGGIPEILDEQFLFKAGDSKSLKDKMQWIVDNYENIKNMPKNMSQNMLIQEYIDKILSL